MHFVKGSQQGGMDIRRKKNAHKHIGIGGSEASFNVISQMKNENESNSFSNRQQNILDVLNKNGRYWELESFGPGQRYMGLNLEEWDHNYRKIPAKLPKYGGRLGAKEPQGQFRGETASQNIPSNLLNKKDSRDRLTCIPVVTAASKVLCLETRPIESGYRYDALGKQPWGNKYLYTFPPFSMINKFLNNVKQVKVDKMLLVTFIWQSQTWYVILLSMSIEKPILLPL